MPSYKMADRYQLLVDGKPAGPTDSNESFMTAGECFRWAGNYDPHSHEIGFRGTDGRVYNRQQVETMGALEPVPPSARPSAISRALAPAAPPAPAAPAAPAAEKLMRDVTLTVLKSMQETPGIRDFDTAYVQGVIDTFLAHDGEQGPMHGNLRRISLRLAELGWSPPQAPETLTGAPGGRSTVPTLHTPEVICMRCGEPVDSYGHLSMCPAASSSSEVAPAASSSSEVAPAASSSSEAKGSQLPYLVGKHTVEGRQHIAATRADYDWHVNTCPTCTTGKTTPRRPKK